MSAATAPAAPAPGGLLYRGFWRCVVLTCTAVFRVWFRFSVEHRPQLKGGCVIAANHTSVLDPVLLGVALRRPCIFLMLSAWYRSPRLGWLYRWLRSIPIEHRGGNRAAMRRARAALAAGWTIAVFPEGGISRDGGLYLGNPGAVALVLGADVPIVPTAIVGAFEALPAGRRWPRPRKVTVRFGRPLLPAELSAAGSGRKQQLAAATERIMQATADLAGQRAREDELRALGRG